MTLILRPGFNTDAFDVYIANYLCGQPSLKVPESINPKYRKEWKKLLKQLNRICVRYQEMLKHKFNKTSGECIIDAMLRSFRGSGERLLIFLEKLESKPDFLLTDGGERLLIFLKN